MDSLSLEASRTKARFFVEMCPSVSPPPKRPTPEESVAPLTWACALLGRKTRTKTKKAERAALKRLKKNLKSIEASGL
jgi:hypothetical protein